MNSLWSNMIFNHSSNSTLLKTSDVIFGLDFILGVFLMNKIWIISFVIQIILCYNLTSIAVGWESTDNLASVILL